MTSSTANDVNLEDMLLKAKTATKNHLIYAQFVQDMEVLCDDTNAILGDERLSTYQTYWLELETVNALALDEWESAGKPADWVKVWNEHYRKDAGKLVARLCLLLRQR